MSREPAGTAPSTTLHTAAARSEPLAQAAPAAIAALSPTDGLAAGPAAEPAQTAVSTLASPAVRNAALLVDAGAESATAAAVERLLPPAETDPVAASAHQASVPTPSTHEQQPRGSVSPGNHQLPANGLPRPTPAERLDEEMFKLLCQYSQTTMTSLKRLWRDDPDYIWTDDDSRQAAVNMDLDRKVVPWISAAWRHRRAFKARVQAQQRLAEEQQRAQAREVAATAAIRPDPPAIPRTILKRKASEADLAAVVAPAAVPAKAAPAANALRSTEAPAAASAVVDSAVSHGGAAPSAAAPRSMQPSSDFQLNGLLAGGLPAETLSGAAQQSERQPPADQANGRQPADAPAAPVLTPEQVQEVEDAAIHW